MPDTAAVCHGFLLVLTCAGTIVIPATADHGSENQAHAAAPLVVGIAGGSGCGKTTLARRIVGLVGPGAAILSTDEYYRTLSEQDHKLALEGDINFDRPEALDLDLLVDDLVRMKSPETRWPILLPSYDFVTHRRADARVPLNRPRVVILEGLFVLAVPNIEATLDIRLFVRDDVDTCLVQRLRRDVAERGIALHTALTQYEKHVKTAYDAIIKPSSVHADLVVPNGTRNERAAELVAGWILSRTAREEPLGCVEESSSTGKCAERNNSVGLSVMAAI